MDAYIYMRVSCADQQYNGSFARQLNACQTYCSSLGWQIRGVFGEVGTGLQTAGRPVLESLVELIVSRKRKACVLCESLDRFSRSGPDEWQFVLDRFAALDIQVVCTDTEERSCRLMGWFRSAIETEFSRELDRVLDRAGSPTNRLKMLGTVREHFSEETVNG